MAQQGTVMPLSLKIPSGMFNQLYSHLFPGDEDEHGAVIGAEVVQDEAGMKLLARKLFLAIDGVDYIEGLYGYRRLTPDFVHDSIDYCVENRLAYIAVHCHGGEGEVSFSSTDLKSHETTYPALLDILSGLPVGGLVLAKHAAAGDIWLTDRTRVELQKVIVPSRPILQLYPGNADIVINELYDRQTKILGEAGQHLLNSMTVGVIGAGGIGSLLVEYLSHLGVGHIIIADPDRIMPSNLPRLVGSRPRDVLWLDDDRYAEHLPRFFLAHKVYITKRLAKMINPKIRFTAIPEDITVASVAKQFIKCDYIFLAADSHQAKYVFNSLLNQYLIPGTQVGVKVTVNPTTKRVTDIYCSTRTFIPGEGCLWCNELIDGSKLNEEAKTAKQRKQQRYIDDDQIHAPSVITLNAVAASHAVDDFLFSVNGMLEPNSSYSFSYFQPLEAEHNNRVWYEKTKKDKKCPECSPFGRLSAGHSIRLPVRWQ